MIDPTEELFAGLDRPRPLPPALRELLEEQLLAVRPDAVPLGEELDKRLAAALTDPVAAALAGVDGPRPLPAQLRETLVGQLTRRRAATRPAQAVLGAAAVVVLVAALAVAVVGTGSPRHRPSAGPPPGVGGTAVGGGTGGVGATGGTSTGGGARTGVGAVPAPRPSAVPGALSAGSGAAAAGAFRAADGVRTASPDSGPLDGGTRVTLHGQGLGTAVAVYFGGRRASSYRVVSDSTVRAVAPPVATPGQVDVVVALRSGVDYRLARGYAYMARPSISSLSPAAGPTGGGTWVTVRGGALSRTSGVSFGGTAASKVEMVSDGELRALSPSHLPGPVDVAVTTPGGTSASTSADRFTYLP